MKQSVLIVDDDIYVYAILKAVLEHEFELRYARNGSDALEALSRGKPKLILLDIEMGGMDGYEVCRQIKGGDDPEPPSIIFVSARCRAEDRLAAYAAGADDFITKPLNAEEVYTKVVQTLASRTEIENLKLSARNAIQTAKNAMGERGANSPLFQVLRNLIEAESREILASVLIDGIKGHGVSAVVQIRGESEITINSDGKTSTMEAVLLRGLATPGAPAMSIYTNRVSFTKGLVSVMVKNMPIDDAEQCTSLQDSFSLLVATSALRAQALEQIRFACNLSDFAGRLEQLFQANLRHQTSVADQIADVREQLAYEIHQAGFLGSQERTLTALLQQLARIEGGSLSTEVDPEPLRKKIAALIAMSGA